MLRELSNMLGFTFTIHDNVDRTYGKYVGGQWKGMIGEVILFLNHPLCILSLSSLFSQFSLRFRWLTARQISLWQIWPSQRSGNLVPCEELEKYQFISLFGWSLFPCWETMTLFREEVVDFTHPFLYIGLGVIGYRGSAPRSLQQLADDHSVKVIRICRLSPFMKKKLKSSWNLSFEII